METIVYASYFEQKLETSATSRVLPWNSWGRLVASLVLVLCQWRCLPLLYTSCSRKAQTVRFFSKEPFIFYGGEREREGGGGGIFEAPFKNRMSPSPAYQLFLHDPPFNDLFYGWPPIYLFFNIFYYLFPTSRYCTHYVGNIYNPYTTERSFFKKHKSKQREITFGSPSNIGHWHLPHLNWWTKNGISWVIFFPRVNDITVILIIVTFICFTAVSTFPVVILCKCPGISQRGLVTSERTPLLQT